MERTLRNVGKQIALRWPGTCGSCSASLVAESQSSVAWKTGAHGERKVGGVLDAIPNTLAFHDLAIPGTRANIDHIAIAASGV